MYKAIRAAQLLPGEPSGWMVVWQGSGPAPLPYNWLKVYSFSTSAYRAAHRLNLKLLQQKQAPTQK